MNLFKTKKWISSKSFWGSLLFAIALWAYTSLNADYQTIVEIPLTVKLPKSRALESPPPQNIYVDVRGTGWNLFNLIFFNNAKTCFVDLSRESIIDSVYRIGKTDLQKSLQFLRNVNPINLLPENINLITGQVGEYEVFVVPKITIIPRNGFTVVGRVTVEPEKVKIRGNTKIIEQINSWNTEYKWFEAVNSPFVAEVYLIDSLSGVIDVVPNKVTIRADIQQIGELIIPDVPISIVNGSLPDGHKILPPVISVTVQAGVEVLANLTPADISAFIDFDKIMNDSTGIIKPIIQLPPNITLLKTEPAFIYHSKIEYIRF